MAVTMDRSGHGHGHMLLGVVVYFKVARDRTNRTGVRFFPAPPYTANLMAG